MKPQIEGCVGVLMLRAYTHVNLLPFYTVAAKPEGAAVEAESGGGAGRKRRWGSSTAVTAKKPSISITTESLKV